jgi:hypothetical protein
MKILLICASAAGFTFVGKAQTVSPTLPKPTLSAVPSSGNTSAGEIDSTGWRFTNRPQAAFIDKRGGAIRFKFIVSEAGQIESAVPVMNTVSSAQEKLCHQALLHTTLVRTKPEAGRATGFYTFKFIVR